MFLQDFAPGLIIPRKIIPLKKFNHRLATEPDKSDLKFALSGKGEWQQVEIPHYGGPVGRTTAFYRTTFQVKNSYLKENTSWLCFSGVDYKCDVYLNGNYVGSHEVFFSTFEFNISPYLRAGQNTLFIKVDNDAIFMGSTSPNGNIIDGDKIYAATGIGWDEPGFGWHHCPPGMGIWQPVNIEFRNPIHICDIFVQPHTKTQSITAHVEVENTFYSYEDFNILIDIFGQNFKKMFFIPLTIT